MAVQLPRVGRGPSLEDPACAGVDTAVFFEPAREAEAKALCERCPDRPPCLAYALDAQEPFGVWGGLNERERRELARRLAKRSA